MSGAGLRAVAHNPLRGFEKGFRAERGFTRNEGVGACSTTVPLQRGSTVEGAVGDVRDMNLWWDGGIERGDAQILPPPGASKVPSDGKKRMVRWCACSNILQAHPVAMGGGGGVRTRLAVGYTWTWASLGFPTGLVRMELSSWSMKEG